VVERTEEQVGKNPWHAYSEELMRRAIQKLANPKRQSDE